MELQFPKKTLTCLQLLKRETQTQEQTQELRMPDDKPDIGKILGTWGQVLLRSKEWRDGTVVVSGGVMTWILYQPEGEDGPAQSVEAWIPFQMKYEIPHTHHDGTISVVPLLRGIDARTTSARKMVARATVAVLMEAYTQENVEISQVPQLPLDVNLLMGTYPVTLLRESGEKAFEMEEELLLPGSCEKPQKIVRFSLQPEILDQKVLSSKIAFRGIGILHLLYQSENGNLCTWDFEIPFSRYADLGDVYEQEALSAVTPVVTGLELELEEDNKLLLKTALTSQYTIFDRCNIEIGQDAYSNIRQIEMTLQPLELPVVLDRKMTTILAETSLDVDGMRIVDLAFYPNQPSLQRNADAVLYTLTGQFHVLLCDDHHHLHGITQRWNGNCELSADENVILNSVVLPTGLPRQSMVQGGAVVNSDILLDTQSMMVESLPMLNDLELGDVHLADSSRPSLILRKPHNNSLWEIAKKCGSTVEAIQAANHLESEPAPEQMLLIPVE